MDFSDCNSIGDIELKQYLLQMTSVISEDELIYHYTSPKGLEGILQNENIELKFTRIDCLNDTTDGTYVIEYYKNMCKNLLINRKIDNNYYDEIIDIFPLKEMLFLYNTDKIIDGIRIKNYSICEYITYVFCFSKCSDSLPMWNYYLKDGQYKGFNLGFSSEKLKEFFHYHPFSRDYLSELIVVEYDDYEKDDIIKDFVEALYTKRYEDDAKLSKTKIAISRELFKWRYSFKSDFFSHEKEVRIAIHLPLNEEKTALIPFMKNTFRHDKNVDIPKSIFLPLYDKSILSEITLSPMLNETEQDMLFSVLMNKGYVKKVNKSKIPIRF